MHVVIVSLLEFPFVTGAKGKIALPRPNVEFVAAGSKGLAIAASVCAHILSLAVPLALLQTYDRILPNQAYATTVVLVIGVAIAILLEAVLRYYRAVLFARAGAAFESRMHVRLFEHILHADNRAVHRMGTPALLDAVRAIGQVRDFRSGNAGVSLHELPFVVIYIALIAYLASWLAIIPLTCTAVAFIAARGVARTTARAVSDVETAETRRRDLTWGIFGAAVEIKSMAAETVLIRRYRDAVARTMGAISRVEFQLALIRENGSMLAQLSTIAVVTFGAFMVIGGELTTGGLAACTLLAGRSIGPAMTAFSYLGRRGHQKEAERKIAAALELPWAPLWRDGGGEREFKGGTIEITGNAVVGGRVSIPQGSVVHVDAPDSLTATQLVEAVAQQHSSLDLEIAYDGLPRAAYDPLSLQRRIGMVSAFTGLIRGTVLDNLTVYSPQYNADAMRLMERLGLTSFVDGLHRGVMTKVGAAGVRVSPGIAARIGLLRALVRRPMILCLDEVSGALDLDGMRRLVAMLRGLKGHVTIFLISGRAELLELADQMIKIKRVASK